MESKDPLRFEKIAILGNRTLTMRSKESYTSSNLDEFLEHTPVFTLSELVKWLQKNSSKAPRAAAYNFIKNRRRAGRLAVVKEGLYFVVRPGATALTTMLDEFLIASKLAPDATLAFHTALDVLGFGHSLFSTHYFFSKTSRRPVRFRKGLFRCVKFPTALLKGHTQEFGLEKVERLGQKVVTTGKERTLVEALEHPEYCGGFEEMYRSLEKLPYLQFDNLAKYLELRRKKKLYAVVGFFLEQHRQEFHVEESFLQHLERTKPSTPDYWDRSKNESAFAKRWNLVVPKAAMLRAWEEF
jgi:predicted transcriptional regulator of viral defense system